MDFRSALAFGTGIGIEIREDNLEILVARVRPLGIHVQERATVRDFRNRPASEWGAEYAALLKRSGASHLSATVLLPRSEIIVRHMALPGVAKKDVGSALAFQIDGLHPYGDVEVEWGWSALGAGKVLVGVARRTTVDRYMELFAEAGVPVLSVSFSAAAIHAALRLTGKTAPGGLLAIARADHNRVKIYGESPAHPVFLAEFEMPPAKAAAIAASELRLPPGQALLSLDQFLPKPRVNPLENDLSRDSLPYAASLAAACPRLQGAVNLLPAERRATNSRAIFVPTAVLAALLLVVWIAEFAYSAIADRSYLAKLRTEVNRMEPPARRSAALDREIEKRRARTRLLDDFRSRTKADLDALNELTKLLPPPIWSSAVDLTREAVSVNGEAEQAAALIKVLDQSPYFQNSEFSVISRNGSNELFRIRTVREGRR
jgi:Tfp pilus assembly protein PilN